jgi:hypothetical protein
MPEASVHEHYLPQPGKYQIGATGKLSQVKPKAKSESMSFSTNNHFGLRVCAQTSLK